MENISISNNQKILRNFFIVVVGSILLTISAKIKIPFYPVPMTMQTFMVLFLGILFGYKIAVVTVSVYLVQNLYYQFSLFIYLE